MTDIQANVVANLGGTLQSLDQLKKKIEEINRATQQATRSAKDHQVTLGGSAKAIGKVGGVAGGMLGRAGEVAGMGGGLGAMAAGAVILGAAFKGLESIVRQQTDTMKIGLQISQAMNQAARQAVAGAQQGALSAVKSQAGARRKLYFRGGAQAQDRAQMFAERGGVAASDAMAGVSAAYDINVDQEQRIGIMEAAYLAASTGEVSMAEAVQSIARNPGARAAAGKYQWQSAAAMVLGGNSPTGYRRAMQRLDRVSEDNAYKPLDDVQAVTNRAEWHQGTEFNAAEAGARKQLADVISPGAGAVLQVYNQQAEAAELLRALADNASRLAKVYNWFTGNRPNLDYQAQVEGMAAAAQSYQGGR
jgi:hypothetical protein